MALPLMMICRDSCSFGTMKETPRRRKTVTSPFNEISTDRLVIGGGEMGSVTPPVFIASTGALWADI